MNSIVSTHLQSLGSMIHDFISPVQAAKIIGLVFIFKGMYGTLAPTKIVKYNGVRDDIKAGNAKIVRRASLCMLNAGISTYCLILNEFGGLLPAAVNHLIWITEALHSLLNNEADTIGPSRSIDLFMLCLSSVIFSISVYYQTYMLLACKIHAVISIVIGLPTFFFPKEAIKVFKCKGTDELTPLFMNALGMGITSIGALIAAYAWGVDYVRSLGYCLVVISVLSIKTIFFMEEHTNVKGIERNMNAYYLDLGLHVGAALAILL